MAEVDVELGPSGVNAKNAHTDEDLIDYDDDELETNGVDLAEENVFATKITSENIPVPDAEGQLEVETASKDTKDETPGAADDPGVDQGVESNQETEGYNEHLHPFDAQQEDHVDYTLGGHDLTDPEYKAEDKPGEEAIQSQPEDHEGIQEIDFGYDYGKEADHQESEDMRTYQHEDQPGTHSSHDDEDQLEVDTRALQQDQELGLADAGPDGEDEITWEEHEEPEHQEASGGVQQQIAEDGGISSNDAGLRDSEEANATGMIADNTASTTHQESFDADDSEFPAITVQYKGEEFPFFSLSSEAFFSEVSVLDDSMENVLVGFREELVNDIATEEELVFQVDELGLEYAESCGRDILSSVTLRHILEIFDLLVKNQDPDSSRTLYTYLFTKPNTSKRFESLAESAAAGKGLDEVMHLFEPPMTQGTHLDETANAEGSYEESGEYTSIDDARAETPAEIDRGLEGYEYDNTIVEPATENDETGQEVFEFLEGYDQGGEVRDLHDPGEAEAYQEGDEIQDQESLVRPGGPSDETFTRPLASTEADGNVTIFDFRTLPQCPNTISSFRSFHSPSASDYTITFSQPDTDDLFPVHNQNHSNAVLNLELDATGGDHFQVENEAPPGGYPLSDGGPENATAKTSTTSTVDNDHPPEAAAEADVDLLDDHPNEANTTERDELSDIDWCDEPIGEENASNASYSATKRARDDDELGMEDGKGVKRRRS